VYRKKSDQQRAIPATGDLVKPLTFSLVSSWVEAGLCFPNMSYKDLFGHILPGYEMGTVHARFMGEALVDVETKYGVTIDTVLPALRGARVNGAWRTNLVTA
jgi:hypothetical protein